jgi:transposase
MILKPDSPLQMVFISRDEALGEEVMTRVVSEVVDGLNLEGLYSRYSEAGRPFYDPAMMLRVLFFAYSDGETSSREIAKKIKYDIRYQYFTGSLRPDFRTINRFRLDNLDLLGGYFARIVAICQQAGLIDISMVAMDGTKIKASASRRRTIGKKELLKLTEEFRQRLTRDAALEEEAESEELAQGESEGAGWNKELKKRLKQAIGRVAEGTQEKVNLTDPDASFMKTSEGSVRPCYNSQVAVDRNQIIVAADVSDNSKDSLKFESLVEKVRENVDGQIGKVLVDGGFYSASNLKYAIAEGLDVYLPIGQVAGPQSPEFERESFVYDNASDGYRCPAGQMLLHKYDLNENGVIIKVYGGSIKNCRVCLYKSKCTKARYRTLRIPEVYDQILEMRRKLRSGNGRQIYDKRKVMVEPVFANMKFNLGFWGFRLRTLVRVKGEFLLMCMAHNLRKLARSWSNGQTLIAKMPIGRLLQRIFTMILDFWIEIINPIPHILRKYRYA